MGESADCGARGVGGGGKQRPACRISTVGRSRTDGASNPADQQRFPSATSAPRADCAADCSGMPWPLSHQGESLAFVKRRQWPGSLPRAPVGVLLA
uniref:Uncharacterized protein n=1 Tax=Plectus sambesii TaxID=2011161 RepID=A0A914WTS3_9BILA